MSPAPSVAIRTADLPTHPEWRAILDDMPMDTQEERDAKLAAIRDFALRHDLPTIEFSGSEFNRTKAKE
jgi:hypothetical protein